VAKTKGGITGCRNVRSVHPSARLAYSMKLLQNEVIPVIQGAGHVDITWYMPTHSECHLGHPCTMCFITASYKINF